MPSVDDDEDGQVTIVTVLDHRPPRKYARDERHDAVNRTPPSPMPLAGPKHHLTVRHRDPLRPLVEPI